MADVQQDGSQTDEQLSVDSKPRGQARRWLRTYLKGVALGLLVNLLTVAGWLLLGPWPPALANVLLALGILGVYGLEDRWAFPLGYWTVEVPAALIWMTSTSLLGLLTTGTQG